MPEIKCPSCRQPCRVAAHEAAFRCARCGARGEVEIELPDDPVAQAPIVHPEPTFLVDAPLAGAGVDDGAPARAHVSCPWCGTFVAPVSVCEACGAGIPAAQPVPAEREVPAPAQSVDPAENLGARRPVA